MEFLGVQDMDIWHLEHQGISVSNVKHNPLCHTPFCIPNRQLNVLKLDYEQK